MSNVKSCAIMYPNSATSVFLGLKLIGQSIKVIYFIPERHEEIAFTAYEEVLISGFSFDAAVEKTSEIEDLKNVDFFAFPNLDIDPNKPKDVYATMCRNLFM